LKTVSKLPFQKQNLKKFIKTNQKQQQQTNKHPNKTDRKATFLVAERIRGPSLPNNVFQGLGFTGDIYRAHRLATKKVID